jgi:hypothetical protein
VRRIDRMSVLETLATALDLPLADVHSLRAMLGGPSSASVDDLRARTAMAWELAHASRYTELADLLTMENPPSEELRALSVRLGVA